MKTCKRLDVTSWDNPVWGGFQECGAPAVVEYHYHLAAVGFLPEIKGATPLCQKHCDETLAEPRHPDNIVPVEEQWQKI